MTPTEMRDTCLTRLYDHRDAMFECRHREPAASKVKKELPLLYGYAETTVPLSLFKWNGKHPSDRNMTEVPLPVGTTVKAVMFSRFGDFGITDDLTRENGYSLRLFPTKAEQVDPENPLAEMREGALTAEDCLTNFRTEEK